MKRIIWRSLTAIGLMSLAYYLNNPRKYNRMAKGVKAKTAKSIHSMS